MDVITYPCYDYSQYMLAKGVLCVASSLQGKAVHNLQTMFFLLNFVTDFAQFAG